MSNQRSKAAIAFLGIALAEAFHSGRVAFAEVQEPSRYDFPRNRVARLPHQSTKEMERRKKQMARAAIAKAQTE